MAYTSLILILLTTQLLAAEVPTVELKNAAQPNTLMPIIGLGVGGYGNCTVSCDIEPLCFHSDVCFANPYNAVTNWLNLGGRRIDGAQSYDDNDAVGKAIKDTKISRKDIFLTEKLGTFGMGYKDALQEIDTILNETMLEYVDLLLIHWPTSRANSSEPVCQEGTSTYDEVKCRLDTWRAMEDIFDSGKARAIGVSNYNSSHLQEIFDHGKYKPAVNQCPYNPHLGQLQEHLKDLCEKHNILFNGYSPLGKPHVMFFPASVGTPTLLDEPVLKQIGQKYNRTSASVILNWQHTEGVVTNPRSSNVTHMRQNLDVFRTPFNLTKEELEQVYNITQDTCQLDPSNYECGGTEHHFEMSSYIF